MKNKKFTYFLTAAVLCVWGLILYRVFDAVGSNDDSAPTLNMSPKKEAYNDFSLVKDTAELLLNYRDPFGISPRKDTSTKIVKAITKKITIMQVKPPMNWSFISYSGYIKNPTSKRLIALLSINGHNVSLAEGETKEQVKLLKNLGDSVKVSYQGKTKFIAIKPAL
jgi:hypothetical protein